MTVMDDKWSNDNGLPPLKLSIKHSRKKAKSGIWSGDGEGATYKYNTLSASALHIHSSGSDCIVLTPSVAFDYSPNQSFPLSSSLFFLPVRMRSQSVNEREGKHVICLQWALAHNAAQAVWCRVSACSKSIHGATVHSEK